MKRFISIATAVTLVATGAVALVQTSAEAGGAPDCVNSTFGTSDTACVLPGVLGSGNNVTIAVAVTGGGGGGGYHDNYGYGGGGGVVTTSITAPEGSTLTLTTGHGGQYSGYSGGAGGGSSAIELGSNLLIEAGGGGGATSLFSNSNENTEHGGDGATPPNAAGQTGGAGTTLEPCSGAGGGSAGFGVGGAAGSTAGACQGSWEYAAGLPGGSGPKGRGGNGGVKDGAVTPNTGGAGYADGGDIGDYWGSNPWAGAGAAGGGGYGGGGGGTGAYVNYNGSYGAPGAGGGGGSYANGIWTAGTTYSVGPRAWEDSGEDGSIVFGDVAPATVVTKASDPTDVSKTGATIHGTVDPGTSDATVYVDYSTDPTFMSDVHTVDASPHSLSSGAGVSAVTGTLTGLTGGTTYYYRVRAVSATTPDASTVVGAVESFTTTGDTPPSKDVKQRFVDVPSNVVIGQRVRWNLEVDFASTSNAASRAAERPNGSSQVLLRGVYQCTAKIVNGSGSCVSTITSLGVIHLDSIFTGTGNAEGLTAPAKTQTGAATVSIVRAHTNSVLTQCYVTVRLAGRSSTANNRVVVWHKVSGKWKRVGSTKSNSSRHWVKDKIKLTKRRTEFRVSDSHSTNTAVVVKLGHNGPLTRGC